MTSHESIRSLERERPPARRGFLSVPSRKDTFIVVIFYLLLTISSMEVTFFSLARFLVFQE